MYEASGAKEIMQNKELTREQFPLSDSDFDIAVRDAMRCSGDPRWHKYLVAHDAALRARLAEVENDRDAATKDANHQVRQRVVCVEESLRLKAQLAEKERSLAAIQDTVGDTEFALRARVAELEQRNTELEGDFLIASEQRKAERQQLTASQARCREMEMERELDAARGVVDGVVKGHVCHACDGTGVTYD